MSMDQLLDKLTRIRANPSGRAFLLADARDPDMTFGLPSFGPRRGEQDGSTPQYRNVPAFLEEIRAVVRQGLVDVMIGSVSTMDTLAHKERLFDGSRVAPAVRINDTTDIWLQRGARYRESPSRPFATACIEEAQFGTLCGPRKGPPAVNLGLYSMTFNNKIDSDWKTLTAFREFRGEAERCGFQYFLEIFAPNCADAGLTEEQVPDFVNDSIVRTLAGVPSASRPLFLKIPYFGPRPLEDLVMYDPSVIIGIMGGSSGTTYSSFRLLADARRHGARAAVFGRRIKNSEHPLLFISMLRAIAVGDISPEEAVRAYYGELEKAGISPNRPLDEDLQSKVVGRS